MSVCVKISPCADVITSLESVTFSLLMTLLCYLVKLKLEECIPIRLRGSSVPFDAFSKVALKVEVSKILN